MKIYSQSMNRYYTLKEIRYLYVDEYLAGALDQIDMENNPDWEEEFDDSEALNWFSSSYGVYNVQE